MTRDRQGERKPGKYETGFMCGVALALASLVREHDQPSMAVDIARRNGITLHDLKSANPDEFDMKPLRKAWRDNPVRRVPRTEGPQR
jgi:hypothetical protein